MISIIEVYSASSTLTYRTEYWMPILRHTAFLLGGLIFTLIFHAIPPKYFSVLVIFLPFVIILLFATRFTSAAINDAHRWFEFAGVSFQPSEIAKLCLITFTAFLLSKKKDNTDDKKIFYWIFGVALLTCGIIIFDNGSTAILLFGIVFLMMVIGRISWKRLVKLFFGIILFAGIFMAAILYAPEDMLKDSAFDRALTWKGRILDFFVEDVSVHDPDFVVNDDNYQTSHAKIAIANGGVFILGRLPGNSIERDFLPQAYADFIYAIIIEELGIVGGIVVLLLYIVLFIRAGIIANRSEKLFPKYIVMGSALILVVQALANMAVAVGLIPVTGQPLPLISRGGTSTLITCIYFGIILSVSRYENPKGMKKEAEIESDLLIQQTVEAESARPNMEPNE
jgi:cell division protein FtsW